MDKVRQQEMTPNLNLAKQSLSACFEEMQIENFTVEIFKKTVLMDMEFEFKNFNRLFMFLVSCTIRMQHKG